MRKAARNQYDPDLVSPPGETLRETLDALGLSQAELADRMGRPKKTIKEIIKGKAALTPDTALQLERVLGISAGFWSKRDHHYREFLARMDERERLRRKVAWLDGLPVKDMAKLGWIKSKSDTVDQIKEILNFFGVATPERWKSLWFGPKVAFRRSAGYVNDPALLAGWLRKGELTARGMECGPYSEARFRQVLAKARSLTVENPQTYPRELVPACAAAGVALVFLPEPPRLSLSGATRWITNRKAVMQMSQRYVTDDQFWLTFFHEAGHLLLHGKRDVFLEGNASLQDKEDEADGFAFDVLLPADKLERIAAEGTQGKDGIRRLAASLDLAPGVLVGLLQHRGVLPHSQFNDLKRLFKLRIG
jgi:addiction module HigA family antidote